MSISEKNPKLAKLAGQTVTLSLYSDGWDVSGLTCRVLDADSAWLLVRADEGKKKERELLIRLDSVKGIKKA